MGFSLYLIGYWKLDSISYVPSPKDFLIIVYLTLPVLVFSFDFSPVVSTFSVSVKRKYADRDIENGRAAAGREHEKTQNLDSKKDSNNLEQTQAFEYQRDVSASPQHDVEKITKKNTQSQQLSFVDKKANSIIFRTVFMLLIFTMFFTFSCILCLDANDFKAAREANIPILSYFANTFASDSKVGFYIFSYAAPLVAFLAIITSFFGHYFGAYEGLTGVIRKSSKMLGNENPNLKKIHVFNTIFLYISIIIVSYLNPSILDFMENISGPIIAIMLLLMPIYAIYTVAKLKKYQNKLLDLFVFTLGALTVSCMLYDSFKNIFG